MIVYHYFTLNTVKMFREASLWPQKRIRQILYVGVASRRSLKLWVPPTAIRWLQGSLYFFIKDCLVFKFLTLGAKHKALKVWLRKRTPCTAEPQLLRLRR